MSNEKQAGPDMSVFLKEWAVATYTGQTEARLDCSADRPLVLEMEVNNANLPEKGSICLLRATSQLEELWAVRVTRAGSLQLQPGTRISSFLTIPDEQGRVSAVTPLRLVKNFKLSISFDPILGGIVLATDFTSQVLGDKCRNAWVDFYDRMGRTPEDTYRVTVGCPLDGRADLPPLGWTISARYRFGPKYAQETAETLRLISEDKSRADFAAEIREALREPRHILGETRTYTATDAALHRLYTKAAEGADHTELSAEWHLGVVAGARSQGWKGGKP